MRKHSRRSFLSTAASAATAIAAGGAVTGAQSIASLQAQQPDPVPLPPVKLYPTSADTEADAAAQPPTAAPENARMGWAVIGLGHIALQQVLPAFGQSERCKVVALVSGDPAKAARVGQQYGVPASGLYSYETFDRIRDNPAIRAVYVALPNSMHAEYTIRAARAGKHVLCEKPMAITSADCQRMIDACRAANVKLMIGNRIEFEPHNRLARTMTQTGKLGTVKQIHMVNSQNMSNVLNQFRLKRSLAGGGALVDVGIYCNYAARFITGEEPIEIRAHVHTTPNDPRFREVEEQVDWIMRFPSGIVATCSSGYGSHRSQRYRVHGSEGWVELDPAFPYKGIRMRVAHKGDQPGSESIAEVNLSEEKQQFAVELDHLAQCIVENRTPYTPGEEGMQDIRVIEAIYSAARSGQPVTLPAQPRKDAFRGPEPTPPSSS